MLIRKLHRQHNSVVLNVPRPVLQALGVTAGDHVILDIEEISHEVTIAKVLNRRPRDAEGASNRSEENPDGGT